MRANLWLESIQIRASINVGQVVVKVNLFAYYWRKGSDLAQISQEKRRDADNDATADAAKTG